MNIITNKETEDRDYGNVILVIGVAVCINILSSSLGIDLTDTLFVATKNIAGLF